MKTPLERFIEDVTNRYGGKSGWAYHHACRIGYRLGGFRSFKDIDWARVTRLVFVCRGNICRSPYAEARARSLGVAATSFGLEANGKSPPDASAISAAMVRCVDLRQHQSRGSRHVCPGSGDLLLGMEPWHGKALKRIADQTGSQVTLLGLWANERRPYIGDPLGRGNTYFQSCFAVIDSAVEAVIAHMQPRDDSG